MGVNRRVVLGAAGIAAAAGAAAAQGRRAPVAVEGGRGLPAEAVRRIAAYAEEHVAVNRLPGLTVVITAADGAEALIRVGYANLDRGEAVQPSHLFQIGSISKSFMALACTRLAEEGRIDLDRPFLDYLPEAPIPKSPVISVRQVIDHVSGLPGDAPAFDVEGGLWLGYEPGSRWSYSNTGYHLLGLMLQRLEGRPLGQIIRRRVLDPLGMTASAPVISASERLRYATGYSPLYEDRPYGQGWPLAPADWINSDDAAGCIASTAADMGLYVRFMIGLSRGEGGPLFKPETAKAYFDKAHEAPAWAPKAKYGNGFAIIDVEGRRMMQHTGGMVAFSSSMTFDPEAGFGIFASTNVGGTGYRPRDVTIWGCRLLAAAKTGAMAPEPPAARIKVDKPGDYAGVYVSRRGERLQVKAGTDSLRLLAGGADVALSLFDEHAFAADHPYWGRHGLVFVREGGKTVRAWWGSTEFAAEGGAFTAESPPELRALEGRYENDSPWNGTFWIYARGNDLYAGDTSKLTRLSDGTWRWGGEEWSPERIRFFAMIGGRAQKMSFSGLPFERRTV